LYCLAFFFWPLYCLAFDIRLLVYSQSILNCFCVGILVSTVIMIVVTLKCSLRFSRKNDVTTCIRCWHGLSAAWVQCLTSVSWPLFNVKPLTPFRPFVFGISYAVYLQER
jgi:hypothetical protein